jgi:uncharacterized protein YndB with AHSA1/START domain
MAAHPGDLTLNLERLLPAPRARVFAASVDPGELARWWGPRGFTAPAVQLDVRVGGRYRIAMQPPEGDLFHLAGEFREVDAPARLAYTFRWEEPHPDDRETLVTLGLAERGEAIHLTIDQGVFATRERRALHVQGWTETLERLEGFLSP